MAEFHVYQLVGTTCPGRNCAAASGAMGIAFATAGGTVLTADQVRRESKISCIAGVDTRSGGLTIDAVRAVARAHGVLIDYGTPARRWPVDELERRLRTGWAVIVLGDYEAAPDPASAFRDDHSAFVHKIRVVDGKAQTHWHDPLRKEGRWVSVAAVVRYWRFIDAVGTNVAGYAGFVQLPPAGAVPDRAAGWTNLRAGDPFYRPRRTWDRDYPVKVGGINGITVAGRRWVGAVHDALLPDGRTIKVRRISGSSGGRWISAWIPASSGQHVTPVT